MNNQASDLREAMGRHLDELEPTTPIDQIRQRARRRRLIVTTSMVALVALLAASGAFVFSRLSEDPTEHVVGPGPAPADGFIAFARFGQAGGIMTMHADGSNARVIAPNDYAPVSDPAWSPDGTKIAFHGFYGQARNQQGGVFVMNSDGSGRRLLDLGGHLPSWSPDGRWVSYEKGGAIFVVESAGGRPMRVSGDIQETDTASWSPASDKVAFRGCCANGNEIYAVDIRSQEIDRLSDEPNDGASGAYIPAWSPNDRWILHKRIRYNDTTQTDSEALYVMTPDGSDVRKVTGEMFFDGAPVWSPDGTRFAVAARAEGGASSQIYVGDLSGNGSFIAAGTSPTWSPDGSRVAFQRIEGTNTSRIYSIAADGTDERQLTSGQVADHSPDWGPSGSTEPEQVATFGRYTFTSGAGFNEEGEPLDRVGTVEINSAEGSVCVESQILGASAAHLHRRDDPLAQITIFEPPQRYRPAMCARDRDPASLQAVIDDPSSYYIEFHNENSGGTLTAHLEPMAEPKEARSEGPYCVDDVCLSSGSGAPGSIVNATAPISGTTDGGTTTPRTKKVLWWWDLPPDKWADTVMMEPPLGAFLLATTRETVGSRYRFSFKIPAPTRPGEHDLVAVIYSEDGVSTGVPFRFVVDRCPQLLRPGKRPQSAMKSTVREYLRSRRPEEARGFSYEVERATQPIRGGYGEACSAETWNRSFIVEGSFRYPDSAKNPSASLAYFRFVVGAARHGWIVWDVLR